MYLDKLIIVEGEADRRRILHVLAESVKILCTNGTISSYELEQRLEPYQQWDVYVLLDADDSGEKIRRLFIQEHPGAIHLYTEKVYGEVETTPYKKLAEILNAADFNVRPEFLQ